MEIFRDKTAHYFKTRNAWRKWLEKNHVSAEPIWLILHGKSSDKKCVKYDEAVEEALCFGWIDSVVYKRDEESRYQYFGKRKTGSIWSQSNRDRVAKLTEAGLMTEAGQVFIDIAKANGAWQTAGDVHNTVIPDDLQILFDKNKTALDNFNAFPMSVRKYILQWIHSAKRPETRQKRLIETVSLAEKNIRANFPVKKAL